MSELIINKKLFDILSIPMQILLFINIMGEGSLMDLVSVSEMSWRTIVRWVPILEEDGLVIVEERKTSVGTVKKSVKLTEIGKAIVGKLLELNENLNKLTK